MTTAPAADPNQQAIQAIFYAVLVIATVVYFVRRSARRHQVNRAFAAANLKNVVPIHPTIAAPPPARFEIDAPAIRQHPIDFVRQLVGPIPRTFGKDIADYLQVQRPAWMSAKDPIAGVYKNQKKVRRDGMIVWAVFVQANQMNFQPGPTDVGGSMIYSLDPHYDENPGELQAMATDLYALKGTDQADGDAATFARMLTLETSRGMGLAVPRRFTNGRKVLHSSMVFPRKHLPNGFVTANILPVWIDPTGGHGLLPVPAAYWPASLLAFWARPIPTDAPTTAQPKQAEE